MTRIDLVNLVSPRTGLPVVRVPTTYAVKHQTATIRSRHCLVYANGVLLREVFNDTVTIPAGKYDHIVVDPIGETRVSGAATGVAGTKYQRFVANKNGQPLSKVIVSSADFNGLGNTVELIRLGNVLMDIPLGDLQSVEPLPLMDGVDVNSEYKKPTRWYTLEGNWTAGREAFLIMAVMNLKLTEDDYHCRLYFQWGTGTETAPVVKGGILTWLDGCTSTCCMTEIVLGCELLSGPTVVSWGLTYPPYYGVSNMPWGSLQVYGIPIRQLCSTGSNNLGSQYPALKSDGKEGEA